MIPRMQVHPKPQPRQGVHGLPRTGSQLALPLRLERTDLASTSPLVEPHGSTASELQHLDPNQTEQYHLTVLCKVKLQH